MRPIVRAVFAEDRLWLLHSDGPLVSLGPDDAKPEQVAVDGKVAEICGAAGRFVAVADDGRGAWTIRQYSSRQWAVRASVPIDGDTLIAMDCEGAGNRITLVTSRRLLEIESGPLRAVELKQELQFRYSATALALGDGVWVAFDAWEWGGGLRRIARGNGDVTVIESNRSGDLCGGPLNTDCDPVHGIAVVPWNPSCVVATIGLAHMMMHGRIVEVCDKQVRRLYFKPFDPQPPHGNLDDGEPSSTIAFYELGRSGPALWALGVDGLYRFSEPESPELRPFPELQNKGGYWVSFDIPDIALVMREVSEQGPASWWVPTMAVRRRLE